MTKLADAPRQNGALTRIPAAMRQRSSAERARLQKTAELLQSGEATPENCSDKDIVELREFWSETERQSWRGQCLCDAELLSRAVKQVGGRGHVDNERLGRLAAAREIVRVYGGSARTLFLNEKLYKTFFASPNKTVADVCNSLGEKDYYVKAAETSDPIATLKMFAEAKRKNPQFNITDAKRMVRQDGKAVNRKFIVSAEDFQDDLRRGWFDETILIIEERAATCPIPSIVPELHRIRLWFIQQRDRTPRKDEQTILALFAELEDSFEVSDLADDTRIPEDEVKEILARLVERGVLIALPRGGETDQARGRRATVYRRVK